MTAQSGIHQFSIPLCSGQVFLRTARRYRSQSIDFLLFNIISGSCSLGGQPGKALVEYRVKFDPIFDDISYQGVPVMSMVRPSTRMSGGEANLHQGAIGAGIDIATGTTLTAVWRNNIVGSTRIPEIR